jgi:hypothetical protein
VSARAAAGFVRASLASLALVACHGTGAPPAVDAVPPVKDVPSAIQVADPSMHVLLQVRAKGVQVYRCQPGNTSAPPYVWALVGPDAALYDEHGAVVGKHSTGPTWELSADGSKVTGAVKSKAVVAADAVPWLLLTVATNAGAGVLTAAKLIQRVDTTGGLPPTSGCDQATAGNATRVDYTASYVFWGGP